MANVLEKTYIDTIISTRFYQKKIAELYFDTTDNVIYYKPKASYDKRDEVSFWSDIERSGVDIPYMISDISSCDKPLSELLKVV